MSNTAVTAVTGNRASVALATRKNLSETPPGISDSSLISFKPQDFVVRNGFPYKPDFWVNAETLVSATGEYLSLDREDAWDIDIPDMHTRFIASESTWDPIGFVWTPATTNGINYYFDGAPETSPILDEVTYRIGKEVLNKQVLAFSPGQVLYSSFNEGIDDASTFSITMALIAETPTDYGIMTVPPDKNMLDLRTDGSSLTLRYGGGSAILRPKLAIPRYVPLFLAMSFSAKGVSLFHAEAPNKITRASYTKPNNLTVPMQFVLGMDYSGRASATLNLLEWGLYDYALQDDPGELREVFAKYTAIYGVPSA